MAAMKIRREKGTKMRNKKKIKFHNYKICLQASQLENKINHLNHNKIDVKSLIEIHTELIKKIK